MVYHSMAKPTTNLQSTTALRSFTTSRRAAFPPMVQLFLFWPKISGEDGAGEDAVSEIYRVLLYNRPILECPT
jgi:hypothetical protein